MKKITNYGKMLICMALVLVFSIGATIGITMTYFGDSKSGSVEIKIGASIYFDETNGVGVAVQDGTTAIVPSQSVDVTTTLLIKSSSDTNVTNGVLKVIPDLTETLEGVGLTLTDGKTYDVYLGGSPNKSDVAKMVVANNALYLVKSSNSTGNTSTTLNELYEITPSTSGLSVKFSVPVTFSKDINNDLSGQSCTIEMKGIVLQSGIVDTYGNDVALTIDDFEQYFTDFTKPLYTTETVGDKEYIYFGSYPQTIKASDVTIISDIVDSNGYYTGSDGEKYAKATADTHYSTLSPEYKASDGTIMSTGTDYYFKVEPLKWRVLSNDGSTALIVCDSVITSMQYQNNYINVNESLSLNASNSILTTSEFTPNPTGGYYYATDENGNYVIDNGQYVFANNYKHSSLRSFLIGDFYNTAFNYPEKAIIQTTNVDNSLSSTGYSSNDYICENTNDKIFALSKVEALNTAYNFTSTSDRLWVSSDYAKANGLDLRDSYSYYVLLRTPYANYSSHSVFLSNGSTIGDLAVYENGNGINGGVVPALNLSL